MPFPFQKHSLKQLSRVVLTSLVITGMVAAARQFGAFESMELGAYDQFIRLKPAEATDDRILVVGISEEDIQSRQEFPIEDGTLAEALSKLEEHNPRAIGIDIARDVPQGPAAGRERLIRILEGSDRIVSACVLSSTRDPGVPPAPGTSPDLVGYADLPQDIGGETRRVSLLSIPAPPPVTVGETHACNDARAENILPSLSLLLSELYLEAEGIPLEASDLGDIRFGKAVLVPLFERSGGYASTGAGDYQVMLNYRAAQGAVQTVSLSQVLSEAVDPSLITDRVVLIGYTSQISNDFFFTPYEEVTEGFREMAGVVVHAQAVSQLLSAALDGRPLIESWPEAGEIAWIWLCALVGGSLAFYNRRLIVFVLGCFGLIAAYGGICFVIFWQGLWLPLVPSILAFALTAMGVGAIERAQQGGYAQAIYEQLRDQLGGTPTAQSVQTAGYLEDLVRRAKSVRQRRDGEALFHSAAVTAVAEDPDQVQFESPEMQTLYERIKTKAKDDWERQRAVVEADQSQRQLIAQTARIKALIAKSRTIRGEEVD